MAQYDGSRDLILDANSIGIRAAIVLTRNSLENFGANLQFFLHFIFGVRVRASGDRIAHNTPAIIIMNHRSRLDWFYFWLALWRMNPWLMTSNKIALKERLKHVPGAGKAAIDFSRLYTRFYLRFWHASEPIFVREARS